MIFKSIKEFYRNLINEENSVSEESVEEFFVDLHDDFECKINISFIKWDDSNSYLICDLISGSLGIIENTVLSPRMVYMILDNTGKFLDRDHELVKKYSEKTYIKIRFIYFLQDKLDIKPRIDKCLSRMKSHGYVRIAYDEFTSHQVHFFLKD